MRQAKQTSAWAPRGCALAAGLLAGLAHPPFGLIVGLLGYALMLRTVEAPAARPLRQAFFRGWLSGLGYFAVSVWWIVEPFMVDAENQGWMAPFALVFLAGGLALFWGAAALAYRALKARGFARVLVFAGCLAAAEWLRGHVLTGFPWDPPGAAWRAGSAPSQLAAVVGVYGLSWITLIIASAPALLFDDRDRRARAAVLALALAALAGLYGFGFTRLAGAAAAARSAPVVRVVQANIDQKEKWRPENLDQIFATYLELSRRPAEVQPQIIIWPEGALPAVIDDLLEPERPYVDALIDALTPGQTLLMGANRAAADPATGEMLYFNSLIAFRLEPEGLRVTGVYDKHRLVPFGEYMPLADLATRVGFRSLVHMPEDFTAGPPSRPLTPAGVPPLQPLVCYEALFPGLVREGVRSTVRPAWILNVSNDAWFGETSGPLQHLNLASYRAIEEGLPIVRATPTGVSAVIDAYGRVVPGARLGLGAFGVIDARLPPALEPTPYVRWNDGPFAVMLLVSGAAALRRRVRRA